MGKSQSLGRLVSVRSTAGEIRIVADGAVIAEHVRRFGRDQLICDPWHYLPILERKPGALRNGVPFREWDQRWSGCSLQRFASVKWMLCRLVR
jgi:hypothetical protein